MAKMFYTMDETKAALGKSDDEIKILSSEGRLREFRDGARLMFKADQVEHLKTELEVGPAPIELSPDDSVMALGIADMKDPAGSTGGGTALADTAGTSGTHLAKADTTTLSSDSALTGSTSGMPSSGRAAGPSGSQSSRSGIDVFQPDESEKVDPSAATSVTPGLTPDQVNIESVGSGSGLLDLTRESDDTSLGAELLDEIAPSASGVRRPPSESAVSASALGASGLAGTGVGAGIADARPAAAARAPIITEAPDPLAPAFGLAAVGAAAVILFAAFAIMSGLADSHSDILAKMGSGAPGGFSFLIVLGMAFALPVVLFVVGLVMAKMGRK